LAWRGRRRLAQAGLRCTNHPLGWSSLVVLPPPASPAGHQTDIGQIAANTPAPRLRRRILLISTPKNRARRGQFLRKKICLGLVRGVGKGLLKPTAIPWAFGGNRLALRAVVPGAFLSNPNVDLIPLQSPGRWGGNTICRRQGNPGRPRRQENRVRICN